MLQQLVPRDRIELAGEASFGLGDLRVEPARLLVSRAGTELAVEPRVMMVLVALAQAEGRVVSRDELVDRCWDGRIVGDNAVQRVISRLRQVSHSLGGFEIQSVTKVGYLLRPEGGDLPDLAGGGIDPVPGEPRDDAGGAPQSPLLSRRLLLGGSAALVAAAGGFAWWRARPPVPANSGATAAQTLIAKAREAQLFGLPEQVEQSIAYLKRATELDPGSAEAWGALALAYEWLLAASYPAELPALADWSRAAAGKALALDPGNVEAKVALATILPNFRNWLGNERQLLALKSAHGEHAPIEGAIGWLRCDTGRWTTAIAHFRTALAAEPFSIANQLILARALWGQGALAEADSILAGAHKLWPNHRGVWRMRFDFLAQTGRPGAALALITDESARPLVAPGDRPPPYDVLTIYATALQTRAAADVERATALIGTAAKPGPLGGHAYYALALGQTDEVFAWSEPFFFGGAGRPAPTALCRRKTSFLFSALAEPLRTHPRYRPLLERLGLFDYWRQSGSRPDFPI